MFSVPHKSLRIIALLAIVGAGFSSLDTVPQIEFGRKAFAAPPAKETRKTVKKKKKAEGTDKTDKAAVDEDAMFLKDAEKAKDYMPEIFRCPECGYEQDETGTCPDHNTLELVKILARGRDPLEPAELDGNEDLIVDVPLKDLQFKKDVVISAASEPVKLE